MELNSLQARILAPFIDNTIECLGSMANLRALPDEGYIDDIDSFWVNDYSVVIETSGLIEGRILIHYYLETALAIGRKIYANMLGEEPDSQVVDDKVMEALSEFSNTVVGLATRELKRENTLVIFDPPSFVSNPEQMNTFTEGVTEILTVPIQVDGIGKVYFNYLIIKEYQLYMTAEN